MRRKRKTVRRRILDRMHDAWSAIVRMAFGHRCALCGSRIRVQAHHWFRAKSKSRALKYVPENGVALCWRCHHVEAHDAGDYTTHMAICKAAERVWGPDVVMRLIRKLTNTERDNDV